MAFEFQPRAETDVFLLRSAIFFSNCRHCVVEGNAEKWRHTPFIPSRVACREEGSDWLNLELLPSDWLNLELLRCDWLNLELLRYDWSSDTLLWLVESRAPSLWLVESRAPSLWLVESRPLGGATLESPWIAPQRNGIRISTTRRDGRVFAKLRNFPHKSTRNEGARLLCRALHAGRKALIGWHTRAPSLWLVECRAPCTRYPQTDALDWIRSYYSAVRVAILLSGPCRTVMSINNADVIKLLRSDRSSDTRALLFYFIIIILFYYYYFILFYFILFYFILFYFILWNTSHSSPPPSSLSPPQPALFADHFRFRSLPVSITSGFDHFRFRSLPVPTSYCSPPAADLAQNVSDNIRCDVINPYLLTWRIWRILSASYILLT